jgi:uncharacterized protein (DUF885 family)
MRIRFLALVLAFPCSASLAQLRVDYVSRFRMLAAQRAVPDAVRLHRLFDVDWEFTMTESPEYATFVGYPGQNARWTDRSIAAIQRRRDVVRAESTVVASIHRAQLNPDDQLSYDMFKRGVSEEMEGWRFPRDLLAITKLDGPQFVADLLSAMPASTPSEYEDILSRLEHVPTMLAQVTALLDSGLKIGVTPPRVTLTLIPDQITGLVPADAMQSALLAPFTSFPATVPAADQARLRARAVALYDSTVRPAYLRLHDYVVQTYIPRSRETLGMSHLPDGQAWYAYQVKTLTTTSRTPAEIHALGLREVARIRAEMDSLIKSTGFTGSFADFVHFLRTDARFYYTDSASLVMGYREIMKRIDPQLPKLFGKLPRLTYGVTTIPLYAAPSQTTAYYQPGSPLAHRAGQYYVNTYRLDMRPKWEMEVLSVHEAVPGHHLQIALSQELEHVPEFRKNGGYTAFVEGWGLYSESLGPELGLYQDPYSKFGQLTYDMWRAIRLVLDTGIHSMDMTRDEAIQYFTENSAKTPQDIEVEVDRYISWPGQALAYKSGQLEMKALRAYAQQQLGSRFDIRAFHDEMLGQGALPLDILDTRMRAWVAAQKAR